MLARRALRCQREARSRDIGLAALQGEEDLLEGEGLGDHQLHFELLRQCGGEIVLKAPGPLAAQIVGGGAIAGDQMQLAAALDRVQGFPRWSAGGEPPQAEGQQGAEGQEQAGDHGLDCIHPRAVVPTSRGGREAGTIRAFRERR